MNNRVTGEARGWKGPWRALPALLLLVPAACDDFDHDQVTAPPAGLRPAYVVTATNYTYTTDAQFDQGTLVNVNHDPPNGNQLQLNRISGTFPFIWVALSQRCTIAKVNTTTGAILGEYRTLADGVGCTESSRTTVAIDGSVWVGHRGAGGVTHVGLNELNQCVDRNNNGTIETSGGYGDVRAWPGASPSNIANATDECILHFVDTNSQGFGDTRHVSIDPNNNLWIGSYVSRRFVRVNGITGAMDLTTLRTSGVTCGGYGGLIDKNGVIWSANGSANGLFRWDPNQPDAAGTNPRCISVPSYGLANDAAGNIFVTNLGAGVYKVSSDGNTVIGPVPHGASSSQGLAVDGNGDVWVSSSLFCGAGCTIGHLKNNLTFVGNVPNPTGAGSTGIAVDAAGKIWSANRNSNTATRIDPSLGPLGADGVTQVGAVDLTVSFPATTGRPLPFPYNYSDMTGSQILGTIAQGSWTVVQDGGSAGMPWGTISWNAEPQGSAPAGSSIVVEARAADTQAGLGGQAYVPVSNGVAFNLTGQFIQVRVTLRASPAGTSPVLSDLTLVSSATDQTPPICRLSRTGTNASGQKFIEVTTRDIGSGLSSIQVTNATNLSASIPAFTVGTTSAVLVTGTKIDQTRASVLSLRVRDVAGNFIDCDPVDVTVDRSAGKPVEHVFTGLPDTEYWVDIQNQDPGLTALQVIVNGTYFSVGGLTEGELRTLDVQSAMQAGSGNTITLRPVGKPGGSAWVLIHD